MPKQTKTQLSLSEAARLSKVHYETAKWWLDTKRLQGHELPFNASPRYRIEIADLRRFLINHAMPTAALDAAYPLSEV